MNTQFGAWDFCPLAIFKKFNEITISYTRSLINNNIDGIEINDKSKQNYKNSISMPLYCTV